MALKKHKPVTEDNGPRANQSIEALGKLRPFFDRRDGSVTVGNACPITDGASAVLVMDSELARAEGLDGHANSVSLRLGGRSRPRTKP